MSSIKKTKIRSSNTKLKHYVLIFDLTRETNIENFWRAIIKTLISNLCYDITSYSKSSITFNSKRDISSLSTELSRIVFEESAFELYAVCADEPSFIRSDLEHESRFSKIMIEILEVLL